MHWIPIFLLCVICPWPTWGIPISIENMSIRTAFEEFKTSFSRVYSSVEEEAKRFTCFLQNVKKIEELNRQDTAQYGINEFADLCASEFKQQFRNLKLNLNHQTSFDSEVPYIPVSGETSADAWDWRDKGAVLPVKNQKQCGSCWAFSAVCAMEGAWFLAGHNLTSLSEEQLVQCATSKNNQGCQGGEMKDAIQWVIKNHGIVSEEDYPYNSGNGVTGECDNTKEASPVAKFSKYVKAPTNETDFPLFVQKKGPTYIAVDAGLWQFYFGGVKKICSGRDLDHGVAVVGFTPDYWIVRNSWGPRWGEKGYIRLKRGVNCDGMMSDAGTAAV